MLPDLYELFLLSVVMAAQVRVIFGYFGRLLLFFFPSILTFVRRINTKSGKNWTFLRRINFVFHSARVPDGYRQSSVCAKRITPHKFRFGGDI